MYQAATLPTIFGGFSDLRRVIISERIDLVHAHQAFSAMANEAVIHSRTMNIPAVFTDHSLFGFADPASILMNKALKFSLADVQRVICVSHTSRENTVLRACIPPSRVYVIPNAVEMTSFYPHRYSDRTSLEKADRTIIVMCRLVYRKGIDLLIAILPVLARKYPHVSFVIGGDGPKLSDLEATIAKHNLDDRVELAGPIPHEKVRDFLVRGSIFLNCSLTEAFCVALVEAAAAGLTIVSTRVGGVPEVLPEDMMILADASPRGLMESIEQALDRVESLGCTMKEDEHAYCSRRYKHSMEQHASVTRMYSWSVVASRTETVYFDAIQHDRKSLSERLHRYHLCGKWFGKICVLLAVMDWLLLLVLQICRPAHRILARGPDR